MVVRITADFQQERVLHPAIYSSIDRQRIFAVAANEENKGRKVDCLSVNQNGAIASYAAQENDVVVWQVANGETGNLQPSNPTSGLIFADCTASGVDALPNFEYQTALFDSSSWQGPAGVGILVVKAPDKWRNPLPHNDLTRVPGSYSIPLVIASSIALTAHLSQEDIRGNLKKYIIEFVSSQISEVEIASNLDGLSKFVSFSVDKVEADRLLLELEVAGFAVDSGSACKSADMQPSHVLAAMNRPITGNIRLTLHKDITEQMVKDFCQALKIAIAKLRKN